MSDTERTQGIRDEIEVLENDRDLIGSADHESRPEPNCSPVVANARIPGL